MRRLVTLLAAASALIATPALAQTPTAPPPTPTVIALEFGASFILQGQVTDTEGEPIPGAVIELWHTDINGNYNHPNDAAPSQLLFDEFQYFGTATADEDGSYAFLTYKPREYGSRPPHLHFKVFIDGVEVLTSQFYFAADFVDNAAGEAYNTRGDSLFLTAAQIADAAGDPLNLVIGNIVLDQNGRAADALAATPAQMEGPFYPVIDFRTYDNNLLSPATDDEPVLPIALGEVAG